MDISGFIKSIHGLSDNTRRNYQASLDLLARTIASDEPTAAEIEAWLNTFDKVTTLMRHKSAIYLYWEYRFPGEENRLPFNRHTFRSAKKKIPKYCEPYVAEMVIEKATDPDDKMFLRTLYIFGCRIRELLRTKLTDLIDTGAVMVVKGGNEQIKVCPSDFLQALKDYAGKRDGQIFPRGYDYYYTLIKRLGEGVGHPEMSPHMFRHARGIDLIDKGADPAWVAQFLGHSNLNTVMTYLALSKRGLQTRIDKIEGMKR